MTSKLTSSGTFAGPNGQLFFEREGKQDGQTVLFVHGLGGTTNSFQAMVPDLAGDLDLVRFDWTGHGRSGVAEKTSINTYVQDCKGAFSPQSPKREGCCRWGSMND
jgi:3-oxoadipate enol-lactonase